MTDHLKKEMRSWNMSRIRGKDTKPEIAVRKMRHAAGFRFRLHVKDLPGKPDIVLPKWKTVVFELNKLSSELQAKWMHAILFKPLIRI